MATRQQTQLALDGGTPAVQHPIPPMYPGGLHIGREEEEAVLEVLRSKRLFRYYGPSAGPSKVAALEEAFAAVIGTQYALAVASGTSALTAALAGLQVGPGDEVIIPAYTWISTAAAVVAMGAVPILAEVDESLTIDPVDAEARITARTRAIIPVHMRGAPSALNEIVDLARRHDIAVLEDVAQADGGSYGSRRLGSIGAVGAFSLQFNKILTCGEGGMVTTNDLGVYDRALMYHDVAAARRTSLADSEVFTGINCRLSELQAAVALVQLQRLDGLLSAMRERKSRIQEGIADLAASKGVEFRHINDPEGDTGIALVFYLPSSAQAEYAARALDAEGVPAFVLFQADSPDYHVYYHWTGILNKRSWGRSGPWDWHGTEVHYSQDMCPRTLDLLSRAVHVDISPDLSERNVEEITAALRKVLSTV